MVMVVLWGLLSSLVVLSLGTPKNHGTKKSRGTKLLWVGVLAMWALYTVCCSVEAYIVHIMQDVASGIATPRIFYEDDSALVRLLTVPAVSLAISVAIGDWIVLWRAFVLCPGRLTKALAVIAPVLVLLIGIVPITIKSSGVDTSAWATVWAIPASALSLISNVAATSLIAAKTWKHRQALRELMTSSSGGTRVQKIMFLLVESGVIYCALCTIALAVQLHSIFQGPLQESEAYTTFIECFFQSLPALVAFYPTILIILISRQGHPASCSDTEQNMPNTGSTPIAIPLRQLTFQSTSGPPH
ncbi:hypothetical protein C8Q78DRAFT_1157430 [Trametes maxima]|nr:hypothetical protein C8Q78DRAFT_1157430 [Trametes maxima]